MEDDHQYVYRDKEILFEMDSLLVPSI